jgi:hypothetical protein
MASTMNKNTEHPLQVPISEFYSRPVNMQLCIPSPSNEKQLFDKIPIVTVATAWTNPIFQMYILSLNQALLVGACLDHSLLCPNQLRHFGHKVDDVPLQLDQVYALHYATI